MKKFLFIALLAIASLGYSQSRQPRFGTSVVPGQDNTGRVLTYGYIAPTALVSTISGTAFNYFETLVDFGTITGSATVTSFKLSRGYTGDRITFSFYNGAATTVGLTLLNKTTTLAGYTTSPGFSYGGQFTVSGTYYGNIRFYFQNNRWVESGRSIAQ